MSYSSQKQIEAILGRCLTDDELVGLSALQAATDNWITTQLDGSTFRESSSTRLYDSGGRIISIDPVSDITNVQLLDFNGDVIYDYPDNEYLLGPYNSEFKTYIEKRGFPYSPYLDWRYDYPCWPSNYGRIKVTGTFGLGDTIPEDLVYLASYMIAKTLTDSSVSLNGLKEESIEGYRRVYANSSASNDGLFANDSVVQLILDNYTDQEILF